MQKLPKHNSYHPHFRQLLGSAADASNRVSVWKAVLDVTGKLCKGAAKKVLCCSATCAAGCTSATVYAYMFQMSMHVGVFHAPVGVHARSHVRLCISSTTCPLVDYYGFKHVRQVMRHICSLSYTAACLSALPNVHADLT